jgi:hypothetical protein
MSGDTQNRKLLENKVMQTGCAKWYTKNVLMQTGCAKWHTKNVHG